MEALRDLLKPGNGAMKIRDSKTGVYIENVTEMYVRDAQEVMDLMQMGSKSRTVNATKMNATSSRSHGVFMLKLTQTNTVSGTKKVSKLMMIDLAGSEKVAKTGAKGTLLKEAQKINQSLSALGNVMAQLSAGKPHISYRDSVLTRLLSDSLGGNCKTTLLIAASPSSFNCDETITTCRFGVRAKKIKNKAKINAEKTVAEYKIEVAQLKDIILKLQTLVKALQIDLTQAKNGEMSNEDKGKSDEIIAMVDMDYIMDDGKKKKKKKPKKKGFFRAGFEPKLDQPKKKKKKKSAVDAEEDNKYDENDEVTENTESHPSTSSSGSIETVMSPDMIKRLKDAEDRAEKAEEHIQYLEAELIKAQAAAATNSGLADIEPPPSPRKRVSILPAPQRPRASLPTTAGGTSLSNRNSSNSNNATPTASMGNNLSLPIGSSPVAVSEDVPTDQPSFSFQTSIRRDEDFESEKGDTYSMAHLTVTETKIQMPQHLADLDPALLEQARRGLQQENYDLRKQMEQLVHELDQNRIRLQKKTETIKLEKNKTEDAEMECDRLLLQQQVLEERIESFEQDRKRERKQIESFKDENALYKKEIEALKSKLAAKQKEMQDQIVKISKREAKRADEFMQQAIKQFKRLQKQQNNQQQQNKQNKQNNHGVNNNGTRAKRTESSAYAQMTYDQQQNELQRQRMIMNQQMQNLKQATFEQLEKIQLEQMRVKSALQSKVEECVGLNMALSEKDDEIKKLYGKIKDKDSSLHRQAIELKAFGDLKIKSDQIHQKEYQKAQDTIYNLKKQLAKLNRMSTDEKHVQNNGNALRDHNRQVMPTPLRGGGRKKKQKTKNGHIPKGPSVTSQFFNQNLRGTPSSTNLLPKYGAASPSFGSVAANLSSSSLNGHGRTPSSRHARNESTRQNGGYGNGYGGHVYKKSSRSVRANTAGSYWK